MIWPLRSLSKCTATFVMCTRTNLSLIVTSSENCHLVPRFFFGSYWLQQEMSFIRSFQTYIFPIVFVIGLIGNGLSFAVMTRKPLRGQVASFYISLLAVLDTLSLSMGTVSKWIMAVFEVDIRISSQAACKIWKSAQFWVGDAVNWIVSLIAFDGFVNIVFPHKAKEWINLPVITLRRSVWMSLAVIIFLFLVNSPILFFLSFENHQLDKNDFNYDIF